MKISSYNLAAGKRAKEKLHKVDGAYSTGYSRDGISGKVIPGGILGFYFDGRSYSIEFDREELIKFKDMVAKHLGET